MSQDYISIKDYFRIQQESFLRWLNENTEFESDVTIGEDCTFDVDFIQLLFDKFLERYGCNYVRIWLLDPDRIEHGD